MTLPLAFTRSLKLPAIVAPMFLTSGPDLVVETCRSGLIGTFPALNARSTAAFAGWLTEIESRLAPHEAAPFGVNLVVHRSNPRLRYDLEAVVAHRVPLVITSLGAVPDVVAAIHAYGGLVFHDVISRRHAEKAAEAGVDGIIAVCGGAGGHAGTLNPFALLSEIREVFDGPVILSGSMSSGRDIAAARMMGAELAYLGTRFIATRESLVDEGYRQMLLTSRAADIVFTPEISGVAANFLRPSLVANGLDPDNLRPHGELDMENEARAWKSLWSAGHGVGAIHDILPAAELCERLIAEYRAAVSGFTG